MLVAEEDWQAIQETSHLLSVPGMHESIKKGMAETLRKCNVVRQISEWFLVTSSRSAISPACETRSRSTPKRSSRSA